MCPILGRLCGAGARRRTTRIPARDEHAAGTCSSAERLGEQDHGEHGGDERLQVRRERRARSGRSDGPTRNQRTFVRTSGPSVAKTSSAQIFQPRSQSWSPSPGARRGDDDPREREDDRARPRRRVRRASAARPRPSTRPRSPPSRARAGSRRGRPTRRRPRRRRRAPRRRAEIAAATQKRALGRSVPSASPKSAAKIGIAPRTSPIVDAVVSVEREHEGELVEEEQCGRDHQHRQVAARDAQRPLGEERRARRRSAPRGRTGWSRTGAAASPC